MLERITVLFPGGFKPMTPAHIKMYEMYKKCPVVKNVILFIGHDDRNGITREHAKHIITNILRMDVNIYESDIPSPVLQCYEYIKEQKTGIYTLGASLKDDIKRIPNFIEKHKLGGKFNHDYIDAQYLPEYMYNVIAENNKPISATIIRDAFINNNYNLFYEIYKDLDNDIREELFNYLKEIICQQPQVI